MNEILRSIYSSSTVLTPCISMLYPFAQHPVGLATAARAAEEHFKDGALEECHLRGVAARGPGY